MVLVAERHLDEMTSVVPVFTAKAMVLAHDGDFDRAKPELAHAVRIGHVLRRARWIVADMNLRWGTISLQLGDRTAAREHADDARAALHGYPDPGTLPARLAQLDGRIARAEELHLTPAELTGIADELNVSVNSVRSYAQHHEHARSTLPCAIGRESAGRVRLLGRELADPLAHD